MAEGVPWQQWQVHYEGMVQGVGFRFTTRKIAAGLPVAGYVKNLPDGRVLVVAEGEPEALKHLLDAVARAMGRTIHRTTRNVVAATGQFDGFEIRF